MKLLTHLDVATSIGEHLGPRVVIAAPGQMCTPYLAVPFAERVCASEHQRRILV